MKTPRTPLPRGRRPKSIGEPDNPVNRLIAAGWTTALIAHELRVSIQTIYKWRKRQTNSFGHMVNVIVDLMLSKPIPQ